MSPLLRRVLEYLREQGPQTEEDLLAAFQVKRAIITRLLKDAHGQVRQQGEYLFLPEQEERVSDLHAVPRALISSYVVLDTETTSLDRAEAQLLEVAALKVQEGRVVATLQLLVSGVLLPGKVAELTGLTQEGMVRASGHPGGMPAETAWETGMECRHAWPTNPGTVDQPRG